MEVVKVPSGFFFLAKVRLSSALTTPAHCLKAALSKLPNLLAFTRHVQSLTRAGGAPRGCPALAMFYSSRFEQREQNESLELHLQFVTKDVEAHRLGAALGRTRGRSPEPERSSDSDDGSVNPPCPLYDAPSPHCPCA